MVYLTGEQKSEIRRLLADGSHDSEIDRTLNLPKGTTRSFRLLNHLPKNPVRHKNVTNYICYNRYTEEFVCSGTARYCANFLGYNSLNTFFRTFYRYRTTGQGKYIIEVFEDLEEENEI